MGTGQGTPVTGGAAANINDYALPQVRGLGITATETVGALVADNATMLTYLEQSVYEVERRLNGGYTVTEDSGLYTLAPDPGEESDLWNVLAHCAIWILRKAQLQTSVLLMGGAGSISDEVTRVSRIKNLDIMEQTVKAAGAEYTKSRAAYSSLGAVSMEQLGLREPMP